MCQHDGRDCSFNVIFVNMFVAICPIHERLSIRSTCTVNASMKNYTSAVWMFWSCCFFLFLLFLFLFFCFFLFYFSASRKIKGHWMYFSLEVCYRATGFSWCTEGASPSSRCWKISQEKWKRWPASRNIRESMMGWALLVGGALNHSHNQRETRSNRKSNKSNKIAQRLNKSQLQRLVPPAS